MKYSICKPRRFWQIILIIVLLAIFAIMAFDTQQPHSKPIEAVQADTPQPQQIAPTWTSHYTQADFDGMAGVQTATYRPTTALAYRGADRRLLGSFEISAYDICLECCGKTDGITSTGTHATVGRTIAVDPKIIPYGTKVFIEGIGYRIAEDCGGAIKGYKVDVLMGSHKAANDFGRQNKKIWKVE